MNPASAKTSINQVPKLHKFVANAHAGMKPFVFDFGAGKEGKVDEFMSNQEIFYAPYDPFNRSALVNTNSLLALSACDFVVSANTLNVLEDEVLDTVIAQLANLTKRTKHGMAYVTVYHKNGAPANRQVKGHFQRNEKPAWYIPHLDKHFQTVICKQGILYCFA